MTPPQIADGYAVAAEYYDLWAESYWSELGPVLRAALHGIDAAEGPILELGAGSGLGTVVIADAVPNARIVAAEPSRAMRGILTSRVIGRADLRDRITILAADLAHMTWPPRLAGFVAVAMLGHLTPNERELLWRSVYEHLAPGAPAVVHLQPPARPERLPPTRHTTRRIGDLDYEGWAEAEPTGDRILRWTMTYRVLSHGDILDEQQWTSDFHTVSEDDVTTEARTAGLDATPGPCGLITLRTRLPGGRRTTTD